jgi:hypothetical protein
MKTIHIGLLCLCTWSVAGTAHAQKKPPACGYDAPVSVHVLDVPADAVVTAETDYGAYVLRSDGGDAYVDGVGRIDARIQRQNCTNDLWVGLGLSSRRIHVGDPATTVTGFNLDRAGSVPLTDDVSAMGAYCSLPPPENYGGCGIDASGRPFVRRSVTFGWSLGNNDMLRMQRAPEDGTTFQTELESTSWVRVYHTAAGPNGPHTWVLSPEPTTGGAIAGHIARPHRQLPTFRTIELPFRIEVTTTTP